MAVHLKRRFDLTLVDLAPRMLDQSRRLNPECRHVEGDMRSLRLGETFDAVLVFDAISHMATGADLRAALVTARAHLRPGGTALFCPDWTVERFAPGVAHGGSDGGGRGMRYIEWTHPATGGTGYDVDLVYLLLDGEGAPRVAQDRMRLGLFSRAAWTRLLREAGFDRIAVAELSGRDVFEARTG
jgi:SAM-dependent methyltransferase